MSTEETTTGVVTVTEIASQKIQEYVTTEKKPQGFGLRVGVKGGGCSGFEYVLELDEKKENDQVFGSDQGRVFVDPESMPYLNGTIVDYVESLQGSGFDIRNPNATGSCGCGSSFSV